MLTNLQLLRRWSTRELSLSKLLSVPYLSTSIPISLSVCLSIHSDGYLYVSTGPGHGVPRHLSYMIPGVSVSVCGRDEHLNQGTE